MERSQVMRGVAVGVGVLAVVVVAFALLRGGDPYEVNARFINAGNLVKGNLVTIAGESVGSIKDIELSEDGQAIVRLEIKDEHKPLREGTRVVVRKRSLSAVAGDVLELQLGGGNQADLASGATIPALDTDSDVALDEVINTFDPIARVAVGKSIRLFRDLTLGKEDRAQQAIRYLNPALSASSRLFAELDRNRPDLERFITQTARLTTDLSGQDDELAGLVTNLGGTMRALASERQSLGQAVSVLPTFLRRTNTTFANLRATLDDVDPLVDVATPVVRNSLRPLFQQLRPFAQAARPTVRDLSRTIRRPGGGNDLIELLAAQPAVDRIANDRAQRNGRTREGAFPAMQKASRGATPQFSFFRPYTPDIVGWFDDFSSSGVYDALGGFSRAGLQLNQFTVAPAANDVLSLLPVPVELRELLSGDLATGRNNRCPGSNERAAADGSNPFLPTDDFACDKTQVPVGR